MKRKELDFDAIAEVMAVAKRLDDKGMVNAFEGNISVKSKKDGCLYVTPTGKNKALYTWDQIAVIDENGEWIGGSCKPTSELPMHFNTYKMRDGKSIGGIVHAHPTFITAYSICLKSIRSHAYPELMGNFKEIQVCPYGRPGEPGIYKEAEPYINAGQDIVILGNHGVLVVGETATDAMNKLEAAESIARILYYADKIGEQQNLDKDEIEMFFNKNDITLL
ncbi:MAG: class II aldolase/adducin family protein [Saccharofermentanales bacterium]|jgi:L-fuculose-phosphate aldolase